MVLSILKQTAARLVRTQLAQAELNLPTNALFIFLLIFYSLKKTLKRKRKRQRKMKQSS